MDVRLSDGKEKSTVATTSSQPTDTDLKDEWWQLFDAQTKRFYYYNAKRELTQWTRPFKSTPHPNHPHTQKEDKSTSSSSSSSSNSATLKMARSSSTASSGSSSMLDNIDSDERPNGSEEQNDQLISSNGNTVCLLASRLVALLMAQLDIDRDTNMEELLEKTKNRLKQSQTTSITNSEGPGVESSSDRVGKEIQLLEHLLALSTNTSCLDAASNKDLFTQSFRSYLSGSSSCNIMSSLGPSSTASSNKDQTNSSTTTPNSSRTPRQPRTNPNYINVNVIDKQNGALVKNTYVRVPDKPDQENNDSVSEKQPQNGEKRSPTDSQMAAVLLMALLNNNTVSPQSIGSQKDEPKSSIQLGTKSVYSKFNQQNRPQNNHHHHATSGGKSLISCFMNTSDAESVSTPIKKIEQLPGSATTSLTRKTIEKKFSFLTSSHHSSNKDSKTSISSQQHSTKSTTDLKRDIDKESETTTNKRKDSIQQQQLVKNSSNSSIQPRNHAAASALAAAAAVAAAVAKSMPGNISLDESITTTVLETSSLDLLSDNDNTTLSPTPPTKKSSLINNAASVSSLADLPAPSTSSSPAHKLKNLRRSFNSSSTAATVKIASPAAANVLLMSCSSSSSQLTDAANKSPFHLHSNSNADKDGGFISSAGDKENNASSDMLVRKTSESNLLYIKTQIDLNVHHEKKLKSGLGGLLFFSTRKRIAEQDLMVWTSQTIEKPLIKTNNKTIKKEACELFKLIQCYMGDRKSSTSTIGGALPTTTTTTPNTPDTNSLRLKSSRSVAFLSSSSTSSSQQPPSQQLEQQQELILINQSPVKDLTALEIMSKGWQHAQLRDELYLQIIKQTTSNLNRASCLLGWQLMALCLSFFPPTQKLYPFLGEYIQAHADASNESSGDEQTTTMLAKLARACLRRLERIHVTGAKKGLKAPTIEEIILSKSTILQASLFGTTLDEIMSMQRKKCPNLQLPWIQTVLSEAVLKLNGARTEGIFRVPGDLDEVNNLKVKLDQLWCSEQALSEHDSVADMELMSSIQDPHLPASLLKLWYRELHEPLIPNELYDECIANCEEARVCLHIVNHKLPAINRLVFAYLIQFLKVFAAADNVAVTKMDANNLSMVMAPNCLRCKSNEPKTIMENTKKEMQFIKTMIQHLDTDAILLSNRQQSNATSSSSSNLLTNF